MKYQRNEAAITVMRFRVMVVWRVLRRSGELSTQRPTLDERHIDATVLTIPLINTKISWSTQIIKYYNHIEEEI